MARIKRSGTTYEHAALYFNMKEFKALSPFLKAQKKKDEKEGYSFSMSNTLKGLVFKGARIKRPEV